MTEPVVTRTVEFTEASRLPDTSWLWRRVLVYVVTCAVLVFLWRLNEWIIDPTETKRAVDWATVRMQLRNSYLTLWLVLTLYCVGASMEELTRLVAAWKTSRKETVTTAPPPVTVRTTPEKTEVTSGAEPDDDGDLPPDQRVNP